MSLTSWGGQAAEGSRGETVARRYRAVAESAVLVLLLLAVVVSAFAGAGTALFCILTVAWPVLAVVVGLRNVLDAGCVFMLVAVGVVVVVDLARNGFGSLLY